MKHRLVLAAIAAALLPALSAAQTPADAPTAETAAARQRGARHCGIHRAAPPAPEGQTEAQLSPRHRPFLRGAPRVRGLEAREHALEGRARGLGRRADRLDEGGFELRSHRLERRSGRFERRADRLDGRADRVRLRFGLPGRIGPR